MAKKRVGMAYHALRRRIPTWFSGELSLLLTITSTLDDLSVLVAVISSVPFADEPRYGQP
jgi:hypothetical protein